MATKYRLSTTPRGYISKISADVLPSVSDGIWLVPGSQNVLIGEDGSTESRKGSELIGQSGDYGGVFWADTWNTNTGTELPMRTIFDTLQVYYDEEWRDVKAGFGNNTAFSGGKWFNKDEQMENYIFVNGTTKIFGWQGGIAEVASRVSGSSLKKTNGATPTLKEILIPTGGSFSWGYPTITQNDVSLNAIKGISVQKSFWEEGFRTGDTINITIAAISGSYTIASVDEANNELLLTTAFPSASTSSTVGEGVVGTVNAYGPLSQNFTQARFNTFANLRFVMLGVVYTYTGGFNTDTLTGITPALPATIPAGTLIFSDVVETTPSGGLYVTGATPDVLTVSRNQAYIAQSTKNNVWLSDQYNYASYAFTVPLRKNGEGGIATLEGNVRAVWSNQDDTVQVGVNKDTWYPLSLVSTNAAGTGVLTEELRVGTPRRGNGVGPNNQNSVCNTKNGIVYLSSEPTLDFLQNVVTLNQTTLPVSDPIDSDLQRYDCTDAKCIYWRNYIWLLLPNESKLIGYDTQRQLWQPPQIISGNCMSLIDDWLVIHSSNKNESYQMFVGTNDNGLPFTQRAKYSYFNGGTRSEYKVMDGYFVEAKVTPATDDVKWYGLTGYKGSVGTFTGTFGSADGEPFVESVENPTGFGGSSFGQSPFGSFFSSDEEIEYRKVRQIFPMTKNASEFFEMQVYFETDKLDAQFKIIAHGENMVQSGSHNSNLIK